MKVISGVCCVVCVVVFVFSALRNAEVSSGILSERPGWFVFPFCFPLPRARCYLIEAMHNSNRQIHQVTLSDEVLLEYRFYVIGFVPADVMRLKKDV